MPRPSPDDPHPMKGFPQVGFLKPLVQNPNIVVGDYSYYDDPEGPEQFEAKCVLYHFPLSLAFAAMSLPVHGWTLNGIGPVLIATADGCWQLWMPWLRHRSWLNHKDSGFAPGTRHLVISAWLGWSLAAFTVVFWTMLTLKAISP